VAFVGVDHRWGGTPAVVVDRNAELLAHGPQRVVVVDLVQLRQADTRRHTGQQDSTGEPRGGRPPHLGDCGVDVVQHDLGDSGAASGCLGAEIGQPPVVGLQTCPTPIEVAGVDRRRLNGQRRLGEERRHRVRIDDLGDDAVAFEVAEPAFAVPVP
jgi:hypothetical protein